MKLARSWDTEGEWAKEPQTVGTVRSELLDAWLHDDRRAPATLDEIWNDLQHSRQALEHVGDDDFSHALADLYCAAYRWHLACTSPSLSNEVRHRQAAASAMDEVRSVRRFATHTPELEDFFSLKWCS